MMPAKFRIGHVTWIRVLEKWLHSSDAGWEKDSKSEAIFDRKEKNFLTQYVAVFHFFKATQDTCYLPRPIYTCNRSHFWCNYPFY